MPMTPDMARKANGQGMANNRGQRQSETRGRDTVGRGTTTPYPAHRDHLDGDEKGTKLRVTQSDKPMGFDERSNTVHGSPKEQPYEALKSARLVGDVMLRQEPKGRSKDQQDDDRLVGNVKEHDTGRPGAVQFEIEAGHHARTIR